MVELELAFLISVIFQYFLKTCIRSARVGNKNAYPWADSKHAAPESRGGREGDAELVFSQAPR